MQKLLAIGYPSVLSTNGTPQYNVNPLVLDDLVSAMEDPWQSDAISLLKDLAQPKHTKSPIAIIDKYTAETANRSLTQKLKGKQVKGENSEQEKDIASETAIDVDGLQPIEGWLKRKKVNVQLINDTARPLAGWHKNNHLPRQRKAEELLIENAKKLTSGLKAGRSQATRQK